MEGLIGLTLLGLVAWGRLFLQIRIVAGRDGLSVFPFQGKQSRNLAERWLGAARLAGLARWLGLTGLARWGAAPTSARWLGLTGLARWGAAPTAAPTAATARMVTACKHNK